jgi:nitrite reductase/ring-hydroxylating ferredoxin subunit
MSQPDTSPEPTHTVRNNRRTLLGLGLLALVYPLLRFVGFRVPTKPRKVEISTTAPANGVLIHSEFILFDRDGMSWALARKCTHLGCKVNYHDQGNYLECPCHQSRFSPDGKVMHGPARIDLTTYTVEKHNTAPFYVVTI